jgi:hypothetical protein
MTLRHDPDTEARIERDLFEHPDRRRFDWVTEFGSLRTGLFPKKHCLFCAHCTDWFWDYTSGPYAYICELKEADPNYGDAGTCWYFEEDDEQ